MNNIPLGKSATKKTQLQREGLMVMKGMYHLGEDLGSVS